MIHSMTGFGHASAEADDVTIRVEISTLNHRYLDIGIKQPSVLSSFENEIRKTIQGRLERGRINVFITCEGELPGAGKLDFDRKLAQQYIDTARDFADGAGLKDDLTAGSMLRISSLWTQKAPQPDEMSDLWSLVEQAVNGALDRLIEMRKSEGANICEDLSGRIERITEVIEQIEPRAKDLVDEYRERLRERIATVLPTDSEVEEQRVLTEVAIFADKADISEEIARLRSHIQQFEALVQEESNIGRRLDFLIQEMFREISTIGSKARDAQIAHQVVDIKGQLEKMREQVQNVQ
jgi:uncharacterized protein (TIGR00255 family)